MVLSTESIQELDNKIGNNHNKGIRVVKIKTLHLQFVFAYKNKGAS